MKGNLRRMVEAQVSFLDCSIECLHLDSVDNQLRLDVLVLFAQIVKLEGAALLANL